MSSSKKTEKTEKWTPVKVETFGDLYEMTEVGNVRRIETQVVLKPGRPGPSAFVVLTQNGCRHAYSIKTLVKETFGERPLTKTERDAAIRKALAVPGATTKSVAAKFDLSPDTVRKVAKVA